jgi:hypothetical protein
MSDASVVTRGAIRLRGAVEWTRIDGTFGPGGSSVLPLGTSLTTNLDVTTLPLLAAGEATAQALAADPALTFNAGRLTTSADSRVATVPITIEYGLTSRIALGARIPIVQSRSVLSWQLNGRSDNSANVGANPSAFHDSDAARAANAAVASGLTSARDQLSQNLAFCAANPGATGCSSVNARAAEASALIAATSSFASGVAALYGVSDDEKGAVFVPIAGGAPQTAIDARLAALRAGYTSFGFNAGTAALAAAQAAAANAQFQALVQSPEFGIGLDSLGTTEQTALGDIELSATALLFNTFASATGVKLRAAAAGVVRLGTGHPARSNRPYDVATGDGQTDIEVRSALDMLWGSRLLTTIAGTFTVQTGSVETTRLPSAPGAVFGLGLPVEGTIEYGNMASIRVNPRYLLTPALMAGLVGIGSYRAGDEITVTGSNPGGAQFGATSSLTAYSAGFTLAYSNLASAIGVGDSRFPAEFLFTHIENFGASGAGVEKGSRDSIELRIYLRTRR